MILACSPATLCIQGAIRCDPRYGPHCRLSLASAMPSESRPPTDLARAPDDLARAPDELELGLGLNLSRWMRGAASPAEQYRRSVRSVTRLRHLATPPFRPGADHTRARLAFCSQIRPRPDPSQPLTPRKHSTRVQHMYNRCGRVEHGTQLFCPWSARACGAELQREVLTSEAEARPHGRDGPGSLLVAAAQRPAPRARGCYSVHLLRVAESAVS